MAGALGSLRGSNGSVLRVITSHNCTLSFKLAHTFWPRYVSVWEATGSYPEEVRGWGVVKSGHQVRFGRKDQGRFSKTFGLLCGSEKRG